LLRSLRLRVLVLFVGLLAVATLMSVLVTRAVLLARLDDRIDQELSQKASELRRFAAATDPSTGEPFGADAPEVFTAYIDRAAPSRGEVVLTFVDGEPFLHSGQSQDYRLDQDPRLLSQWGGVTETRRGEADTPAGQVEYLAVPLKAGESLLGVFVVAQFRDVQREPFDEAFLSAGMVGLAVLLVGALLAWVIAERILRPVRVLTHAAQGVTGSDLTERIVVRGESEFVELAETFNAMLDRLEGAFAAQRGLFAEAAAQLRTPLNRVRGLLEQSEDDLRGRAAARAQVGDELDRLSRMVDDLLLLASAKQPDFLHLQSVSVARLTDEAAMKATAVAAGRWRLDSRGHGDIVADGRRLTQALAKLAEHAAARGNGGNAMAVGSAVENGVARFWVREEGSRSAEAEQAGTLADLRRPNGETRTGAATLALSIAGAIAEAHEGRVEVWSSPGSGPVFVISVPVTGPLHALQDAA
jgi:signal transduction histidine kinase